MTEIHSGWIKSSYSGQNGDCTEVRWVKSSYSNQNGECTEVRWAKSSYSGQYGDCTEVLAASGRTEVRDSKRPTGPRLAFAGEAWGAFLGGLAGSDA